MQKQYKKKKNTVNKLDTKKKQKQNKMQRKTNNRFCPQTERFSINAFQFPFQLHSGFRRTKNLLIGCLRMRLRIL